MLSLEWNNYLPVFQASAHYVDIHQLRKGEPELTAPVKLNMWEAERPLSAFSTSLQRSNGNTSWSSTATWSEPCNRLLLQNTGKMATSYYSNRVTTYSWLQMLMLYVQETMVLICTDIWSQGIQVLQQIYQGVQNECERFRGWRMTENRCFIKTEGSEYVHSHHEITKHLCFWKQHFIHEIK